MIEGAVLIAGPTASGKSEAALALARREKRVIVNADSMQVYEVLRVLTARPDKAATDAAPHLLYGHVHPTEAYSVAKWAAEIRKLAADGVFAEHPPIFVGGTGLYFRVLTEGLAEIPEIPPEHRRHWRAALEAQGPQDLHRALCELDRRAAVLLNPADGQRIVRALEVFSASGRSILEWQARPREPLVDNASARKILIEPKRSLLAQRIDTRFDRMIEEGAADEVRRLAVFEVDAAMPAAKAIGVRELQEVEQGKLAMEDAVVKAKAATRQYAKRQWTWFRHQLGQDWRRVPEWRD